MTTPGTDERRLTDYLLGRLPADEQARLEEEYLADPDLHEQLRAVERDLIDQYVRGELADREAFEKGYLSSPPRRARVEFARTLMEWSDRASGLRAGRPFLLRSGAAWQVAAAVSVVVAAGLLAARGLRPSDPARPGDRPAVVEPAPPGPPSPAPPSESGTRPTTTPFVLMPNAARSSVGPTTTLLIRAGHDLRLQLELETADYASYRVVLRTAAGQEAWRADGVAPTPSGPSVVVVIPADRLTDDDYTIRVGGITGAGVVDEVSGYTFRLSRRR